MPGWMSGLYDLPVPLPVGMAELAVEMREVILRHSPLGATLWPPVASSAYATLLSGDEQSLFCAVTWDASPLGWAGAGARWGDFSGPDPVLRDLLLLGSWPACWDVSEQPFREALGGALAFEAFTQSVNVSCRYCVLRNDAAAAVASFRKGSTQSPKIQRCALRLDRAAAAVHVTCLPLHVPGITLVAEGIDGASCSGAELGDGVNVDAILGPDVSDQLWSTAACAAADAGLGRATVDAFATESKVRFPRLARFHEPGSEAICSLSMPDWARSACPTCGVDHRDVVYAYTPDHLVRAAVEKKMVDRTLCILVVPVAILAPYWNHLLSASVLPLRAPYADGFARVRRPAILVQNLGPASSPSSPATSVFWPGCRRWPRARVGGSPSVTPVRQCR